MGVEPMSEPEWNQRVRYCPECHHAVTPDKIPDSEASLAVVCPECAWYEWLDDISQTSSKTDASPIALVGPKALRRDFAAATAGFVWGIVFFALLLIAMAAIARWGV